MQHNSNNVVKKRISWKRKTINNEFFTKDSKKFISFSLEKSDTLDSKNDRSVPLLTIQHENWK